MFYSIYCQCDGDSASQNKEGTGNVGLFSLSSLIIGLYFPVLHHYVLLPST